MGTPEENRRDEQASIERERKAFERRQKAFMQVHRQFLPFGNGSPTNGANRGQTTISNW
jgi:hypothetical protein